MKSAAPRILSGIVKGVNDLLQVTEPFFITGSNDLSEYLRHLLEQFHRFTDQDRISHD